MNVMKMLSILALVFTFFQCGSSKFITKPPFQISSTEYSKSVGDLLGVSSINVTIQLKEKSTIQFDSLYFKNRVTKVEVKTPSMLTANYKISKNIISDIIIDVDPTKELKNKAPIKPKFDFELKENEAVLSYQFQGKTRYIKIKNIKKVKNI
jgi:hypothetical protein